jgi:hypothetical protein
LLTGRVTGWSAAERARYVAAEAVAVTVYAHVFNSNPAIDDAQVLVLDDAHAAESYVSGPWRVEIGRDDGAYLDVLSVIADALDPLVVNDLRGEFPDSTFSKGVYLASPAAVAAVAPELEQVLRAASNAGKLATSAQYALTTIRGHVDRCLLYVSYRSLLIRPLISPTGAHAAFDDPKQRMYMSATLGSGGELERSFGRTRIDRIPAPRGWDRQGTGRRFFCLPELATDAARVSGGAAGWIRATIAATGKALVLAPDGRTADAFREQCIPGSLDVYDADDIEADLDVFAAARSGVLLLANRYDGIDLPDESCRLVVLQSLPARGDLQERFLYGSLGASEVLQERLRARVVQGAGRATRNSGDYAVVIIAGADLTPFCVRRDVQGAMHPEINAELRFGVEESLRATLAEMTDNIRVFSRQDDEWRAVEQDIVAERDGLERLEPPGATELERSAPPEVRACLAAWQGEWERALEAAKQAIDALRGGRAPQRYAALWNYLAAGWSVRLADQTNEPRWLEASDEYMKAARAAGRGTVWLSHLAAPADVARRASLEPEYESIDLAAAAAIQLSFSELSRPRDFEPGVLTTRTSLERRDPTEYEAALVHLGRLAGADTSAGNGGAQAAPDATWIFGNAAWVCWEAKSDAEPTGELGATDVRQAGGHLRYASGDRNAPIPSGSVSIVVTPQQRIHPSAERVAEEHVCVVAPDFVSDLCDRVTRSWRTMRGRGSVESLDHVLAVLRAEGALPSQWLTDAMSRRTRPPTAS